MSVFELAGPSLRLRRLRDSARAKHPSVRKQSSATSMCAAGTAQIAGSVTCALMRCQTYDTIGVLAAPMLRFLSHPPSRRHRPLEVEFDAGPERPDRRNRRRQVDPRRGGRAAARRPRVRRPRPDRRGDARPSRRSSRRRTARELIVRREITAQGRSRAFVDGALATSGRAARCCRRGWSSCTASTSIRSCSIPPTHLDLLDAFAGADADARRRSPTRSRAWQRLRDERERLAQRASSEKASRAEFLAFQLAEIDRVGAAAGRRRGAGGDAAGAGQRRAAAAALRRGLRRALRRRRRGARRRSATSGSGRRARRARPAVRAVPRGARRHQVAARGPRVLPARRTPTASTPRRRGCRRSRTAWRCSSAEEEARADARRRDRASATRCGASCDDLEHGDRARRRARRARSPRRAPRYLDGARALSADARRGRGRRSRARSRRSLARPGDGAHAVRGPVRRRARPRRSGRTAGIDDGRVLSSRRTPARTSGRWRGSPRAASCRASCSR